MADLTSVGVTSGVPSSGTGTVATINQLIIVGSPISNGSTSAPVIASLVGPSSTITSSMTGVVTALSYISSATVLPSVTSLSSGTVNVTSGTLGTVVSLSSGTVNVTSGTLGTLVSLTSGIVGIGNAGTVAAVKGANTAPSTADAGLVVSISPNSVNANGQALSSNSAPVVIASNQPAVPTTVSSGTITLSSVTSVVLSSLGWGASASSNSTPVVPADQYGQYTVVPSSNTQFSLGSSAGRTGDYLAYLTVFPTVAASGSLTIFDSTSITIGSFVGGGTTALPSLVPFRIDIGAYSASSGWKVTTSSNISAVAIGKFT